MFYVKLAVMTLPGGPPSTWRNWGHEDFPNLQLP